jgi:hypothetical protein
VWHSRPRILGVERFVGARSRHTGCSPCHLVAALFPPTANAPYRAVLIAIVLVVTTIVVAPMIYIRLPYAGDVGDPIEQPIAFDHRHHVRDDGIDCVYCHETVETEASAGIPSTERCMGCHGQIWPASPELAPLRASWRDRVPVVWKRVNAVPDYCYFHHGVHVHAGVACARCHGNVENMPRVYRVHNLSMNFCLDCHRQQLGRGISRLTTCTACHR